MAIEVIEGQRTQVAPNVSGLPAKMPDLLAQLTHVTFRDDFTLAGARSACDVLREHRFRRFREGRWFARAGLRRGEVLDLRLAMCQDCGAVRVTDVSYDVSFDGERIPLGRRGPNRRNHILGWYSGARPNQRTFTGGSNAHR
jgi:hypothetical protein